MQATAGKQQFVDVILPLPLPQYFTYSLPPAMAAECEIGKRAVVQFGKRKIYTAVIRKIHTNKPEEYETKPVTNILDALPIINPLQLKLWEWLASYYMCTVGEVMKAALPAGLKLESETRVRFNQDFEAGEDTRFTPAEEEILSIVNNTEDITVTELTKQTEITALVPLLHSLLKKNAIVIEENLRHRYKHKTETYVKLADSQYEEKTIHATLNSLTKAPKQLQLLMTYVQMSDHFGQSEVKNEVKKADLLKKANTSHSVFNALVEKEILESYQKKVSRLDMTSKPVKAMHELNESQARAIQSIEQQFEEKDVVLLHGVTSSGKTEVYIQLIQNCLKQNKQVLYLLPEIALTAQIITRLKTVFGRQAGVYHSKFNDAERLEIWNNVLAYDSSEISDTNYLLVLGVRSSVFLPFSNLGLIIVDEEHENTYKQFDPAPRYNARDTALILAKMHGAKTLLGTATPSIETYFNTQTNKFGLVEMTQRFKNIQLPEIIVADMAEARRKKQMKSHFTPVLLEQMQTALDNQRQVILFQNRRGFSPFIECQSCGWVPKCKHCDVSLTYHKQMNHLVCHYCGYTRNMPKKCKACGDINLKTKGFGTEKIEDEIAIFFPQAKIRRMDLDSTRSKKAYVKLIEEVENNEVDILIGTQMITKGLDFDNVSVVGILNADNLLNFPDFRAFERSFQLMAQVSGRAGRKDQRGKVIIQTSQPRNFVINDVIQNNYQHLYDSQIAERKQYNYPPFCRLIRITLKHRNLQKLNHLSDDFARDLRLVFGRRVLGPEFPLINRIQNWYLKTILLKIEREKPVSKAKKLLQKTIDDFKANTNNKGVVLVIDPDPM